MLQKGDLIVFTDEAQKKLPLGPKRREYLKNFIGIVTRVSRDGKTVFIKKTDSKAREGAEYSSFYVRKINKTETKGQAWYD